MKLALLVVFALVIVVIDGNFLSRTCKCKAVSNSIHFRFQKWELSSCKACKCSDASMTNCEQSCRSAAENYAKSGCGIVTKGSKVKYAWDASTCSSGISTEEFVCA